MPRIVKWEEKVRHVRPTVSLDLSFLTEAAEQKIENAIDLDEVVSELSTELWLCEHMLKYASPFINIKEKTWEI